jgi:hypothetical protein
MAEEKSAVKTADKAADKKGKPLVERASTVPTLDQSFGYYWEVEGQPPQWHTFVGQPEIFRRALADALLSKHMTRLYFAADGIWVEMPIPQIK